MLVFRYKAKVSATGDFKRPKLGLGHVDGFHTKVGLGMEYKKRIRGGATALPELCMNIKNLPVNVYIESTGFLTSFRIEV